MFGCRMVCKCNQGLHMTWMTKMNATYGWENLPNGTFEWATCTSTSTYNSTSSARR